MVEGLCSCTAGLLVEGRNITNELDTLWGESSPSTPLPVDPTLCNQTVNGCQGVTISDHSGFIYCTNSSSCLNSTFINVDAVVCGAHSDQDGDACRRATFVNVGTIFCLGNGTDVCRDSVIHNTTSVQCRGSSCNHIVVENATAVTCDDNSCELSSFMGVESVACTGDGYLNCYKIACDNVSSVECGGTGFNSCAYSTFSNVKHSVTCNGSGGYCCMTATFSNVSSVTCSSSGTWACIYAQFFDVDTVTCSGDGPGNSQVTKFYRVNTLICSGNGFGNCHLTELYDVPSVQCIGTTSCNPMEIYNTDEVYSVSPCTATYCDSTVECFAGGELSNSNC